MIIYVPWLQLSTVAISINTIFGGITPQALNQLVPGLMEKIQTSVKPILTMPRLWEHSANQSLPKQD